RGLGGTYFGSVCQLRRPLGAPIDLLCQLRDPLRVLLGCLGQLHCLLSSLLARLRRPACSRACPFRRLLGGFGALRRGPRRLVGELKLAPRLPCACLRLLDDRGKIADLLGLGVEPSLELLDRLPELVAAGFGQWRLGSFRGLSTGRSFPVPAT